MDHPNVVSLKHCFFSMTAKNERFLNLVMEYVPETIYRVLRHYSNIFRGLAYIHTVHGVSHKDVKPQNLLVSDLRSCLRFSQIDQLDAKHVGRDGLAAGKGVVVAMTLEEAYEAIDSMLVEGIFGSAGCSVVIEEFLEGEEASFFALVDGENAIPLESAQDHKCVGDGDTRPNTGGIGAYSQAPILTEELKSLVMSSIILLTVKGMSGGRKFVGVLYVGLMIEKTGAPKLIEYNVHFGDPECQVSHNPKLTYLIQVIVKVLEKVLMLKLMPPHMQGNEPTLIWAWSRNFPGSKGNSFIFKIHHKYESVVWHDRMLTTLSLCKEVITNYMVD
ncbi:hypothetical protein IFM89_024048 [Coptis chinensis]|uniref:Uncharacterized protein n=1 Tax=Coptis chinensis TaxID=261450 RepID=A0A835LSM9_9MAGN|nr:hypothetical protein IFM89_024048 [Coptis chinensis]